MWRVFAVALCLIGAPASALVSIVNDAPQHSTSGYAFIASASGITDANSAVTASLNSTGAALAVCAVGYFPAGIFTGITDSKSNSWTLLTAQSGANVGLRMGYSVLSSVGSGHTFTFTGTGTFPAIACSVFSLAGGGTPVFDNEVGAHNDTAASLATGSLTPAVAAEVQVTAMGLLQNYVSVADGSLTFTKDENINGSAGVNIGVAIAHTIQTGTTAANPTWTQNTADNLSVTIAGFKP